MSNYILISILTLTFFAFKSEEVLQSTTVENRDSSKVSLSNNMSVRFVPETKTTEIFDTLLTKKQLQITILSKDLDSYVTNEYEENGKKQIDKYRDAEKRLIIKQNLKILLDTVLRKEQFQKFVGSEFMDIAIFLYYGYNKLKNNRIEFLGVFGKPETCWTIDFYHYFDLKTKKLIFRSKKINY